MLRKQKKKVSTKKKTISREMNTVLKLNSASAIWSH